MSRDEFIIAFAKAIGKMEGFFLDLNKYSEDELRKARIVYVKDAQRGFLTVNQAYNNPGNLVSWGKYPVGPKGFVIFPAESVGWTALEVQISKNIARGLTFTEFFAGQRDEKGNVKPGGYPGYAPFGHGSNRPEVYARFVVSQLNKQFGASWKVNQRIEDICG